MNNRKSSFVFILTALLLSGFLTTCFVSYFVAHDSISTQLSESTLPLTSDNIYSEIQQDLGRPIFISSLMANDTFMRDWVINGEKDSDAMVRYLSEIQQKYNTVTSFFISEKTRNYYHSTKVLKKVDESDPQDEWYFRVREMQPAYEINVDKDTADLTSMTIFINHKVYDYDGNYIGVTGVGLKIDNVKLMIKDYQEKYGRCVYFIDRIGNVKLSCSDRESGKNIAEIEGVSTLKTRILTSPSSSFEYKTDGFRTYLNSRLIPEFDWFLIVEQLEGASSSRIAKTLWWNLLISLVVTITIIAVANMTIGRYQRKLEEMATVDKLTGANSRQVFDILFDQVSKLSHRNGEKLSLIMFDLDYFKSINDSFGHSIGDIVLMELIYVVKNHLRDTDLLFRWGGEEFIVLLEKSDLEAAREVAENLREAIEQRGLMEFAGRLISTSASFGVTQFAENETKTELIMRADEALYQAKQKGRNTVDVL